VYNRWAIASYLPGQSEPSIYLTTGKARSGMGNASSEYRALSGHFPHGRWDFYSDGVGNEGQMIYASARYFGTAHSPGQFCPEWWRRMRRLLLTNTLRQRQLPRDVNVQLDLHIIIQKSVSCFAVT